MSSDSVFDWPENDRASAALMAKVAHGEEQALAHLYDLTSPMLTSLHHSELSFFEWQFGVGVWWVASRGDSRKCVHSPSW
jgi:hypothetical protein